MFGSQQRDILGLLAGAALSCSQPSICEREGKPQLFCIRTQSMVPLTGEVPLSCTSHRSGALSL